MNSANDWSAFVPAELCWRLAETGALPKGAFAETGTGALLHIDIRGWGSVVASAGGGAPAVTSQTTAATQWLQRCCEAIADHGGDVIELHADQITAIWREESELIAAARATACGLATVAMVAAWNDALKIRPRITASVNSGDIVVNVLRDHMGRGHIMLSGDAVAQRVTATAKARTGDVVLAPRANTLLANLVEGTALADQCLRVTSVADAPRPEPLHRPLVANFDQSFVDSFASPLAQDVTDRAAPSAELTESASILSVRLPALTHRCELDRAQRVFAEVTEKLCAIGAVLIGNRIDDTGLTVSAMFSHEDAAQAAGKAVVACEHFVPAPRGARAACCFGVAGGPVLRATVGGMRRATVWLGDLGRLSKALAQRASAECLSDKVIAENASQWVRFEDIGRWRVSGSLTDIEVHKPIERVRTAAQFNAQSNGHAQVQWRQRLSELYNQHGGGLLLLRCEQTELSAMSEALTEDIAQLSIAPIELIARLVHRLVPAQPWRQLADTPTPADAREFHAIIQRRLAAGAVLQPSVIVLTNAQWLDAASWTLALQLVDAINNLLIIAIAQATETDQTWRPPTDAHASAPIDLLTVVQPFQRDSLHAAINQRGEAQSTVDAVDSFAQQALEWRGWHDAIDLSKLATQRERGPEDRLKVARRQLRVGDASTGLGAHQAAVKAYQQALATMGRDVHGRLASAASMPQVVTRITDRFRSPWRDPSANAEEKALVEVLLTRVAASLLH